MRIESPLTTKEYLSALKNNMSSSLDFGQERFTGFFIGRLFYVTHHCDYEWDRRLSSPKNATMGYVGNAANGCSVRFLTARGMMCPLVFLPVLCIMLFAGVLMGAKYDNVQMSVVIALIVTVIYAPINALIELMSERSEAGHKALLSMLMDPTDPYTNIEKM